MPRFGSMWALGVANLTFTAVGLLAVATLLGFPLFMGAAALGVPQDKVALLLAYSSPLWAPLGAGFGLVTAGRLMQGVSRGADSIERKNTEGSLTLFILACVAAFASVPLAAYLLFWR